MAVKNLGSTTPTSEQDAQKVVTYNEVLDEFGEALAGYLSIDASALASGTLDRAQSLKKFLKFTGVLPANREYAFPPYVPSPLSGGNNALYIIWNATSGAFTLKIKIGSGTAKEITQGMAALVFHDGTDVYIGPQFTPGTGVLSGAATRALDNLSAVAINAALVLATSDAFALGSATKMWSDLFLALGGVINFDNGDVAITHSANALAFAGAANGYSFDAALIEDAYATFTTFWGRRANGTLGSPTAVVANDIMLVVGGMGWGSSFPSVGTAQIRFIASETYGATTGARLSIHTTPIGSTTIGERLRVTDVGNIKIAGTVNRGTTEGTNHLDIFDGTAPVGTLANGVSLYSTAGELRVMDAGGTATLLSQHSQDAPEWLYDNDSQPPNISCETNCFAGRVRFINFTRQARLSQMVIDGDKLPSESLKRKIVHEETFAEYNQRLSLDKSDPRYLIVADWDTDQESQAEQRIGQRAEWTALRDAHTREVANWQKAKRDHPAKQEAREAQIRAWKKLPDDIRSAIPEPIPLPAFAEPEPGAFTDPEPETYKKKPRPKWLK